MSDSDVKFERRALMKWSGATAFGGFGILSALSGASAMDPVAKSGGTDHSAQENAAAKVVEDFLQAWPSRDVDRLATYMTEDVVFQGTPNEPLIKGKAGFIKETVRFMALPFVKDQLEFATSVDRIYAIGGATGTVVIALRTDILRKDQGTMDVPLVGSFWVVNGLIKQWNDFPLVNNLGPGEGQSW